MKKNKSIGEGQIHIFKKHFLKKRITNAIDYLREIETDSYKNILRHTGGKKLNPLRKKEITEKVLIPGKKVQMEWWYFTGHLKGGIKEYGFEWCMFKFHPRALRLGFIPLSYVKHEPFLVLHTTITDKTGNKFYFEQDTGVIHTDHIDYNKLDLKLNGAILKHNKIFEIKNKQMDLKIAPIKKLVKHFEEGYHLMDKRPKSPTYYVTYPRSKVKGKIKVKGQTINVTGQSWFDHQKCALPQKSHLLGWDWFSIMLNDNTELMLITLRDRRGLQKYNRMGTYIKNDGKTIKIKPKDFKVKHVGLWKSQETGITYPAGWHITIPKFKIDLKVTPYVNKQEVNSRLTTLVSYWEGACKVEGTKKGKKIKGKSYVELVGYDNRIISKLIRNSLV